MTEVFKQDIIRYLESRHSDLYRFWTAGTPIPKASVEAHCDLVYSLYLLDAMDNIAPSVIEAFCKFAAALELPGWQSRSDKSKQKISAHNCAYLFGSLNLLAEKPAALYDAVLAERAADIGSIVDATTGLPVFSRKWAHHNWRVSHWLGGVPSLLLSLERSGSATAGQFVGATQRVREALAKVIDPDTGLIRAYKSKLLQRLFRCAYRLRHDPDLGDAGGIAHILWVDHALGRDYTAASALLRQSSDLFNAHAPFMESVPYCLDFDIVQIVRTAGEQLHARSAHDQQRAAQMMEQIETYFKAPGESYTLHKVPGALAAYHECAFIAGKSVSFTRDGVPIDVIKRAYWL